MTLSIKVKASSRLLLSLKRELNERRVRRQVRKAELMINELPAWQQKDLNLRAEDLRQYFHTM